MKRFGSLLGAENIAFALFLAFMLIYPSRADEFSVLNAAYFLALTLLALSLAMIWGKAGILSFGQTAFFGVGGYLYGIYTLNVLGSGATWVGIVVGVLAGGLVAAVLGYFMFYGGVNDVFVGLTTLALTLVLQTFMAQTAGSEWAVGKARLNGYNGMFTPQISIGDAPLYGKPLYFLYLAIVVAVYLLLRWLSSTRWGYGLLALQENRPRTESFGYNVRLMQVQVFFLAGCVAALSGVLYASWGSYIDPSAMGLTAAITPVIYVAIGGRRNLTAALISSMILLKLSQTLASAAPEYALVIFGLLALVAVLFVPEGFVAALFTTIDRWLFRRPAPRLDRERGQTASNPEGAP
ncbi:MAG: urea ABC transporter permease [Thermomicrobiales bacterium]|nr:urea ABC transporter permease [Thermomicrobiales bacterium]